MEKGTTGTSPSSQRRTDPGSRNRRVLPRALGTTEFASTFSRRQNAKPRRRPAWEQTTPRTLPRELCGMQPDPRSLINTLSPSSLPC